MPCVHVILQDNVFDDFKHLCKHGSAFYVPLGILFVLIEEYRTMKCRPLFVDIYSLKCIMIDSISIVCWLFKAR